ncbi:Capsular polysaccharide biosynthesis protein [Actinokineospora alba]|uniref:Capsular polysaccharide biosynthesis protein n=1 Tax=Actinokineospora alba TaxID=504798 RepID=A0A1H0PFY8_9PSEU|nr:hypothetical protein [Actinokineospora alba]TDP65781.1 capsular polysaccharide biosynthesis protein [Actinokineospora alba]SDI65273.1 Capsular polysaccharide biosynthesis protein [Actinokineospora alba]SDP03933.1 Capsular polysaccharide biosynthesis protein [Actinokineospora alba]
MSETSKNKRRLVIARARERAGQELDFVSALKVLGRHWVVVGTGLGLMLVAAVGIFVAIPPTYEAKASDVLLVPAQVGSTQAGQANPYLGFGGALGIVAEITARRMNDPVSVEDMKSKGATAEYLVDIVPGEAPVLQVTAKSKDEQEALNTARIVEKAMGELLQRNQLELKAPQNLLIVLSPVTTATQAEASRGSQMRALAGMLAVGLALTVLAAFMAESVQARKLQEEAAKAMEESGVDEILPVEIPPVDLAPGNRRPPVPPQDHRRPPPGFIDPAAHGRQPRQAPPGSAEKTQRVQPVTPPKPDPDWPRVDETKRVKPVTPLQTEQRPTETPAPKRVDSTPAGARPLRMSPTNGSTPGTK